MEGAVSVSVLCSILYKSDHVLIEVIQFPDEAVVECRHQLGFRCPVTCLKYTVKLTQGNHVKGAHITQGHLQYKFSGIDYLDPNSQVEGP